MLYTLTLVAGVPILGVALDEFRVEVVVALVLFLVVRLLVPAEGAGARPRDLPQVLVSV